MSSYTISKFCNGISVPAPLDKPLQLTSAFLLGVIILFGVGFVNVAAVHNAAHDVRHSQGFPCH